MATKKKKYTATFSDKVVTRASHRDYTHAWRVVYLWDYTAPEWKNYREYGQVVKHENDGFCGSERLARNAIAWTNTPHPCRSEVRVEIVAVTCA